MADTTTIVTLYDDAAKTKAFAPRTKVEAISNSSGTGLQSLLDNKMALRPNYIELGASADGTVNDGFIDWHFNGSTADYTSRIIESASGTLAVNGVSFSSSKITSGTWNGSTIGVAYGGTGITSNPSMLTNLGSTTAASVFAASPRPGVTGTLAVGNGGTGQTTGVNAANYFLNALSTGSSTPTDADYYISQYVGGGTTTTTYHRRPMSALWTYIKGKSDSTYVNVTGDTMTGNLTISHSDTTASSVYATNSNGSIVLHASTNKGIYDTDAGVWLIYKEKSTGYTKIPGKVVLTNANDLSGSAYNGPALTIGGDPTAAHIEIDCNEIVAKANATTTATLWLGDGSKVVADNKLYKGNESTNVPAVFISSSTPTALQTGDIWFIP